MDEPRTQPETEPDHRGRARRLLARPWWTGLAAALVVLAYYLMPLRVDRSLPVRILVLVVVLGGLAVLVIRQMRRADDPVGRLVVVLLVVVMTFAGGFYALAQTPGQFVGIETRTDALYFTVVTMTTIGYGDIHASGQAARVVVMLAIVFNLVFVAALGSSIVGRIREATPRRHRP